MGTKKTSVIKMQRSKNLSAGLTLSGILRPGVVVCFKFFMGVPWHAFPPEGLQ
jgi:hypothetical protein